MKIIIIVHFHAVVTTSSILMLQMSLSFLLHFQFGLHQMRASKDEGKPEPHTLIKFGNPYFRDAGGMVRNQRKVTVFTHE